MNQTLRVRLAASSVLFLVLVTGFLLGVAWDRADEARGGEDPESELATPAPDEGPPPIVDMSEDETVEAEDDRNDFDRRRDGRSRRPLIVHGVGIDEEQEEMAYEIVDRHRQRWRELSQQMEEEYDPLFKALQKETRGAIRDLLSPEKAVLYDSLLAAHDRREAEHR